MIELYSDKYHDEVMTLVKEFYDCSFKEYEQNPWKQERIEEMINFYKNKVYLLIVDNKCEGIFAGTILPMLSDNYCFYEFFFYVREGARIFAGFFIKGIMERLKEKGIKKVIIGCTQNLATDRVIKLYDKLGFKPFEMHFYKEL